MAWPPWAAASLRGKPSASFLFFFFLKQIQKQPVWGLRAREAWREAVRSIKWDGGQYLKLGGTRGGIGERCAGQPEPTQPQEVVPAPPPGRQGWLGPCSAFGSGAQRHGSPQPHLPALSAF